MREKLAFLSYAVLLFLSELFSFCLDVQLLCYTSLSIFWKKITVISFSLLVIFDCLKHNIFCKKFCKTIFSYKKRNDNFTLSKRRFLGCSLALTASLLAAMADVIPKPILENADDDSLGSFEPVVFVFLIYLINGLFFTVISRIKTNDKPNNVSVTKQGRKTILVLVLIGIAEAAGTITYYMGLKETSAVNSVLLGNGETVFAILFAIIIFRERLQRTELFAFVLILIGSIFLPTMYDLGTKQNDGFDFVFGDILILISGIFYAIDIALSRFMCQKIDSKKFMQIVSISAALFSLMILLIFQIPFEEIKWHHVHTIIITGIFGMGLSSLFVIIALKKIDITRVVVVSSTTTVFGIVLSALYLGVDDDGIISLPCVVMVVAGMYFLRKKLSKSE